MARLTGPDDAPAVVGEGAGDLTLAWPFRVMQLLDLLNEAAGRLGSSSLPLAETRPSVPRPADTGRGLRWLREAFLAGTDQTWYRMVMPGGTLRLCPARRMYWASSTVLDRLRAHGLSDATFHPMASPDQDVGEPGRRFEELLWWAGRRAPVPPEDTTVLHRLLRWPDIGYLRETRADIPSCAHLAVGPLSAAGLAARTGRSQEEEAQFLHACGLLGYLQADASTPSVGPVAPTLPRGWRGVVARLRAHLEGLVGSVPSLPLAQN